MLPTNTPYPLVLLALVMLREARGEGLDGMRAVAHVIANRVHAKWGDWEQVILGKNQFSSMTVLGDSQTIWYPTEDQIEPILEIAEKVMNGTDLDDPTHGAVYYANLANVTSGWFKTHIADVKPVTAVVGHHTFFGA